MPLNPDIILREVKTRDDLDKVTELTWICFYEPLEPAFTLFHPLHGHTEEDRLQSLEADKQRKWDAQQANPSSHWFLAIDESCGKAVGCVQWIVWERDPFPGGPQPEVATMWPEGVYREFVSQFLTEFTVFEASWMRRPHVAFNQMVVLPEYRRQGVGSKLMSWGIDKADALGLECWTEASVDQGDQVYPRFGFRRLNTWTFIPAKRGVNEFHWNKLCWEYGRRISVVFMWRPVRGQVAQDAAQWPWDIR